MHLSASRQGPLSVELVWRPADRLEPPGTEAPRDEFNVRSCEQSLPLGRVPNIWVDAGLRLILQHHELPGVQERAEQGCHECRDLVPEHFACREFPTPFATEGVEERSCSTIELLKVTEAGTRGLEYPHVRPFRIIGPEKQSRLHFFS